MVVSESKNKGKEIDERRRKEEEKELSVAYILGISLGVFGAHHFYLGRKGFGILYVCTLGLFGFGYVLDLIRMRGLVKHANKQKPEVVMLSDVYLIGTFGGIFGAHHFYLGNKKFGKFYAFTLGMFTIGWIADLFRMKQLVKDYNDHSKGKSVGNAFVLALSPFGILGAHHYYLGNVELGLVYTLTFGIFSFGWVFDLFRIPDLYKRFESNYKKKYTDEAYMYWFPFGIFGFHRFYLKHNKLGILYACTLGCLGIGWFVDGCRMPILTKECNKRINDTRIRLENIDMCTTVLMTSDDIV